MRSRIGACDSKICQLALVHVAPLSNVEQVVDACDDSTEMGARDRAIVLLLSRLGLRSGDILGLRLSDIDWAKGSLAVSGKSTWESELPLTQEIGDALLTYLKRRPAVNTDKVFIRVTAPIRPLAGPASVANIVRSALRRAGVQAPTQGAHLLRHSAATEMLRQGISLQDIQTVLRHRSIETTTIYAKVDVRLLKQIAQPLAGGGLMLMKAVESYLAVRRAAGYKLKGVGNMLRQFARFAMDKGECFIRSETAIE